jgi:hypothetical protein
LQRKELRGSGQGPVGLGLRPVGPTWRHLMVALLVESSRSLLRIRDVKIRPIDVGSFSWKISIPELF